MKLLSIDTSSDVCSVAILEDGKLIKELNITDSKTHSENLMPLVDALFKVTNLTLTDMQAIACSIGPGSFTGIRIGIGSVKAMAEVFHLPVIGVTSLETLACFNGNIQNTIVSLIDAKNNQVYCGIFDSDLHLLEDYLATEIAEVISHLKKYSQITFVGNGSIVHKVLLEKELSNITFSSNNVQSAFALGKCAYKKWKSGKILTADTILPLYLRPSQAERMRQNSGM